MTEEQYLSHKPFAGDKHPSMLRRRAGHDYSGRCMYLVTMTIDGRRPLLGQLVGSADAPAGSPDAPRVELTPLGQRVRDCWLSTSFHYPEVRVVATMVMPDHLHGILFIEKEGATDLGRAVRGFKAGCNRAYRELFAEEAAQRAANCRGGRSTGGADAGAGTAGGADRAGTRCQQRPTGGAPSSAVAFAATSWQPPLLPVQGQPPLLAVQGPPPLAPVQGQPPSQGLPSFARERRYLFPQPQGPQGPSRLDLPGLLWSPGYNDHILEGRDELQRWLDYLADNPRRLAVRRAHPEYFRVVFGLSVGGHTFSAIGNRQLLGAPWKVAVQCSRSLTEAQVGEAIARYLCQARAGAVLVSPAISKGEQAVMRAALDGGLPLVFLTPWGFSRFSKPGHQYYAACSGGRFLILAPWPHQNERIALTRSACLQLNAMARDVCALQ